MMRFLTYPSFRDDGSVIQLIELLEVIPDNRHVWSVLYFEGTGIMPNDLSVDEFEDLVRSKPNGLMVTWTELRYFARSLTQTYDCLIVAAKSIQDISGDKSSSKESFGNCEVVVEAFDSSEWSVWVRDSQVMSKFVSFK